MLLDLVSPWLTAVETNQTRSTTAFRDRHAPLLEQLRRQRAPHTAHFPLAEEPAQLQRLARRATDPVLAERLREAHAEASRAGADGCSRVVLLAGDGSGHVAEPVVATGGDTVLFLDRTEDNRTLVLAMARSIAALTRWRAPDSSVHGAIANRSDWDLWEATQVVPLREWMYCAGLGAHLGMALIPGVEPHELLGVSRTAFDRLRQRERALRRILAAELDEAGIGLVLRWLTPAAPIAARRTATTILPPLAGRYLAWRMTSGPVERLGLRDALRAPC